MVLTRRENALPAMLEDPITKSKRVTDSSGAVVSTIELDPWGGDTARSNNSAFQPRKYTSYERDANGGDEAMFRRYNRSNSRFDQPDPYDGSYDSTDPQSFNRYAYVQNDPVNFIDPSGLCSWMATLNPDGSLGQIIWLTPCVVNNLPGGSNGGGGGGGGGGGIGLNGLALFVDLSGIELDGGGGGGLGGNPFFPRSTQNLTNPTAEQLRKQNLAQCLAAAEAKMDNAGQAEVTNAANPLNIPAIPFFSGVGIRMSLGASLRSAGVGGVLASQTAKGGQAYWSLFSPNGFMAQHRKDAAECHSKYGS